MGAKNNYMYIAMNNMRLVSTAKLTNWYSISALFVICILVFVTVFDVIIIAKISPWHDELWNMYASLQVLDISNGLWSGCAQNMCVNLMGRDIPVLSGPYHGVIKSYIFAPFVLLGDVSIIRIINLIIYFSPLLYLFKQKEYFGESGVYLISAVYFLYFPNLIYEAIFDQGQFVVCSVLLVIASLEILKSSVMSTPTPLVLAIVFSSMAIYEKLTNIPVAISLIVSALAILVIRKKYRIAFMSGFNIVFIFPYLFYLKNNLSSFLGMTSAQNLTYSENFKILLNSIYNCLFERSFTLSSMNDGLVSNYSPIFSVVLLLSVYFSLALMIFRRPFYRIEYAIVYLIPVFSILLFPYFDGLNRPWHIYQLSPLIVIPFALLLQQRNIMGVPQKNNIVKILLAVILTIGMLNSNKIAVATVNHVRVHPYDDSLFVIADKIKRDKKTVNIVCLDYSVCYNLVLVLGRDYKLLAEWAFAPEVDILKNIKSINAFNYYLIAHTSSKYISGSDVNMDFLYGRSFYLRNNLDIDSLGLELLTTSDSDPGYVMYFHKNNLAVN